MNAQDCVYDLFKKHLAESFENKQPNPLKSAIVGVLDEYYALQDKDEKEYLGDTDGSGSNATKTKNGCDERDN